MNYKQIFFAATALIVAGIATPAMAASKHVITPAAADPEADTFSSEEMLSTGHQFFGKTSRGLAKAVEYAFEKQGRPSAYIVGEEGSGAVFGGLRYGEGTIYYKSGVKQRIYWQGPSIGFDLGGNGSRALVLVYNSTSPRELHDNRFAGVEGSAYFIGGLGVNFQRFEDITLAPIRTGVGARLGANIGYLKYTRQPDWNPF